MASGFEPAARSRRELRAARLRRFADLTARALAGASKWLPRHVRQLDPESLEAKLQSAERFRRLTVYSVDMICETTMDGRYLYASPNYETILGYTPEEMLGESVFAFCHPDERADLLLKFITAFSHLEEGRATFRYRAKSGEWRWFEGVGRAFLSPSGPRAIIIKRDVTEQKLAQERMHLLEERASRDARTGLPNQIALFERLAVMIHAADEGEAPVAVLTCTLDGFNLVRDTRGRAFCDELLIAAGVRLQSALPDGAVLGILDDGCFALVVSAHDVQATIARFAEHLLKLMREPFFIDGSEVSVTASMGVGLHPLDGDNVRELVDVSELAMHRARHAGRDRFLWASTPDRHGRFRRIREAELREAIASDQFHVHYQPILDAHTQQLESFEALVRWQHPVHGLVAPDDFIPLAERSGLIVELGILVLRRACAQLVAWRAMGFVVPRIAINVSAHQVWRDDLVERIAATLLTYGLAGSDLEVELTETIAMGDAEAVRSFFEDLRTLDVKISIDDFGTGYSSLAYLQTFPIQRLKIDRAFIAGAESDPERATIVRTIVALARGFNLRVVAEGVETEAQATFVRDVGCDEVQGYLFSRPLDPVMAEAYLRAFSSAPASVSRENEGPSAPYASRDT